MKKYYLKNYNRFVALVWLAIGIMFCFQNMVRLPVIEGILFAACIILVNYPFATHLSTKVLRRAMQRDKMRYFTFQFLIYSLVAAFFLLIVCQLFTYLESIQVFPPSEIFSGDDLASDDFVGSIMAALLINLGFCGLRFYEENLRLQKILIESQLQILQAQINPHFMFNVLNHIHVLMRKDVDVASDLLLNYSDILRHQLYNGKKESIKLEDEIAFLKKYIDIEQLRWNGQVDITTRWVTENEKQEISPLLFITFIENAFKYVERSSSEKGYVNVELRQHGNTLELVVVNSKQPVAKMNKAHSGIGLENIRQRLNILYPEKYELVIEDEETVYTSKLTIHL